MSDKPYPYNEDQLAWLRDLETTEEQQTTQILHVYRENPDFAIGFCCLGRACAVLGIKPKRDIYSVSYAGCNETLPHELVERLCLRSDCGDLAERIPEATCLTDMNDSGWPFKKIAAYIRANPWNVFRDPEDAA